MALFRRRRAPVEERDFNSYSLAQYVHDYFTYQGHTYPVYSYSPNTGDTEPASDDFEGLVRSAYRADGVVFACMLARLSVFSDVRFQFRELRNGAPGDLIGNPDGRNPASRGLALLRTPWLGATTGDLLARMIQDVDISGNAFVVRMEDQLVRLRPDWVTIVAKTPEDASLWHPAATVAGYIYTPGGTASQEEPISFLREDVAHFAPTPDPSQRFRGISWLEPVIPEIMADKSATRHKQAFFDNGATV